jgi:hypothetical protein
MQQKVPAKVFSTTDWVLAIHRFLADDMFTSTSSGECYGMVKMTRSRYVHDVNILTFHHTSPVTTVLFPSELTSCLAQFFVTGLSA